MTAARQWKQKTVLPEEVLSKIKPGMNIFLGTGVAEPRTLIKHLLKSSQSNLRDLEIIQLISLGDAIPLDERYANKYRLKTFFSGRRTREAIASGLVDIIPTMFSEIPHLFKKEAVKVDAAFVQVTPPDEKGFCSLGVAVDVARCAMERASLVVGEINDQIPRTFGDTSVPLSDFHYFVTATEPPLYMPRWPVDDVYDRVAANAASVIEDGSCIAFFIGILFEALVKYLVTKRDLGIHSLLLTDPVMDVIRSGAVTNSYKKTYRGTSLVAYAQGTPELMRWLDGNHLVEFQRIDVVTNPRNIGQNDKVVVIMPGRKVDLAGRVALHTGKGNIIAGIGAVQEFFMGAQLSKGGRKIFALPSRNIKGKSNILLSAENYPNQFSIPELIDMIVTEYGVAYVTGKTLRERALALIDIAHPEDRENLVQKAKESKLIYRDQIYRTEVAHLYPEEVSRTQSFKGNITIRFRPVKPSDVDDMRRLFYRFSDQAIFYRYFSRVSAMPHKKMQEYVSIDYLNTMSLVGVIEEAGLERIIAEGRYTRFGMSPYADVSFIVDEKYHNKGIASFILEMLETIAKGRGIEGFSAYIQSTNTPMIKVMEKAARPHELIIDEGLQAYSFSFRKDDV
jgi:acyl-CoA hydrolase/RimJ/RimL family protein N-acetyltransferase